MFVLADLLDASTMYSLSNETGLHQIAPVGQFFYTLMATPHLPLMPFLQMIMLVMVVGALAYYTTRLIGGAKYGKGGRRNLEIVESMGVGPQSFVHVLKVGKKYVLIGVTRGQVSLLTELEEEQLVLSENSPKVSFESFVSKFQKNAEEDDGLNSNGEDNNP